MDLSDIRGDKSERATQKLFSGVLKQVVSHLITSSHNTIHNPIRSNLCCLKFETELALQISQNVFLNEACILVNGNHSQFLY